MQSDFQSFPWLERQVGALTGVDSYLNPLDSFRYITHVPLLIPLPVNSKTGLGR